MTFPCDSLLFKLNVFLFRPFPGCSKQNDLNVFNTMSIPCFYMDLKGLYRIVLSFHELTIYKSSFDYKGHHRAFSLFIDRKKSNAPLFKLLIEKGFISTFK